MPYRNDIAKDRVCYTLGVYGFRVPLRGPGMTIGGIQTPPTFGTPFVRSNPRSGFEATSPWSRKRLTMG